eukprot:scaffold1897_cov129-Isochrysis_galbana.AAC.6
MREIEREENVNEWGDSNGYNSEERAGKQEEEGGLRKGPCALKAARALQVRSPQRFVAPRVATVAGRVSSGGACVSESPRRSCAGAREVRCWCALLYGLWSLVGRVSSEEFRLYVG